MADVLPGLKARHLVGLVIAFHLFYSGQLELAEDEAYYWVWSEHLAWGYLDHPPAIAALIRAGTAVLGDTELGVRLVPTLLGVVPLLVVGALAKDRVLGIAIAASMPVFGLGGVLATPDVPLVAAWALALWARLEERWVLVGIACGLAMLSKHTGALLLPCLLAADPRALWSRGGSRGPLVAVALAFVVCLPNALWNLSHDLVSWRFQLAHVARAHRPLEFLGAQVGLAGLLLFVPFTRFWIGGWRGGQAERVLWWSSAPLLVVATVAGGEANWAAPAFVAASIAAANGEGRWRRIAWAGVGVAGALSALVLLHAQHPLFFHAKDPLHRLRGGRTLGETVAAWGEPHVYTVRYQEAALIHFYGKVPAHALPGLDRMDQYDLWPTEIASHALFVRPDRGDAPLQAPEVFPRHGPPNLVVAFSPTDDPLVDEPVRSWQVFEVWRSP